MFLQIFYQFPFLLTYISIFIIIFIFYLFHINPNTYYSFIHINPKFYHLSITQLSLNVHFLQPKIPSNTPLLGMATGRVWDGSFPSHSRTRLYSYFPSPAQTCFGAGWLVPIPVNKKINNPIPAPSRMPLSPNPNW